MLRAATAPMCSACSTCSTASTPRRRASCVAGNILRSHHVRCIRREAAIDDDPVVDGDAGCSRDLIVRCDADADHHDLGGVGFAGGIRDDEVIVALARAVGGGLADHGHTAVAIRLRHRLGQARGERALHRRSAHEHGHRHVVLRQCGGDLRADVPAAHDDSTAASAGRAGTRQSSTVRKWMMR